MSHWRWQSRDGYRPLEPHGDGWVISLSVGLYVGFAASNEMSKFMKQTSENIYDRKPIFEGVF